MLTFNTPGASQPGLAGYGPGPDIGSVAAPPFSTMQVTAAQTYSGPGDLVAGATAWYGLRAYSAAVAASGTQKAINIRRASDNTTMDILILSNGNLDIATAATFLASTTGFVTTWYDQSGNGYNATQATQANQPQLVFNQIASLPSVVSNGSQWLATPLPSLAQPLGFSAITARTANFTAQSDILAGGGGVFFSGTGLVGGWFGAGPTAAAANSVAHAIQWTVNGGSSAINVDGTDATGLNFSTGATGTPIDIFAQQSGYYVLIGYISEVGVWPSAFSAANRAAMRGNQKAYWGTP